jgi:predicted restriction endonuclease
VSASTIDKLIEAWIRKESNDLKNWMISSAGHSDRLRIERFFEMQATTPVAIDINEPESTERTPVTTYRILRDTALARRIKADQDYKCQLCGARIILSGGQPYAEAHHVKPLGKPHEGPDTPDNILCVCPNCHVRLDYGAIKLASDSLQSIRREYIEYHNEQIWSA